MTKLDPRINPYRDDLAAASLQNRVRAAKYVEGEPRQISAPSIQIRVAPRFDAQVSTEALSGEMVTVFDVREGWAWLQLQGDGYVGYTTVDGLSTVPESNTHRISARLTYLYPAADMKRPPVTKLSFSATVAVIGRPDGRFLELSRGGFVFADHLVGIRERVKDYVRVAERFVGAPYLWGGKTFLGIDCSGLVQVALDAAGVRCPRDSDMQADFVGNAMDASNLDGIQRGDLLFWQGHVAIAQSPDWMLHASGHHMEVVVEPIRRAIDRIAESYGPLLRLRRPVIEVSPPEAIATERPPQIASAKPAQEDRPPPRQSRETVPSLAMPADNRAPSTERKLAEPRPADPKPAASQGPHNPKKA